MTLTDAECDTPNAATLTDAEFVALMHSTFGDDANDALQWSRDWRKLADSAFASGAASVRAVPREPTKNMLRAGIYADVNWDTGHAEANMREWWTAMYDDYLGAATTGEASE